MDIVEKDKVVFIEYELRDSEGNVVDSTAGRGPLSYLHGHGNLIVGLERALEGRASGDHFDAIVQPEEGYGAHDPAGVIEVPRASLSPDVELDLGVMVETQGPHGRIELTVVAFDEETVCLDCNHPLAGHVLHFTGTIGVIRDAHPDEIKHHRVHPAGHHLMVSDSSFDESLLSP